MPLRVAASCCVHLPFTGQGAWRVTDCSTWECWFLTPALRQALLFYVMSQFFCGILLGFVFIQSHNGMEIYSDRRDFVSSQLASTRNIHGSLFNDWYARCMATSLPLWLTCFLQVHRRAEPPGGAPLVPDAAAAQPGQGAEPDPRLLLQARHVLRGARLTALSCVPANWFATFCRCMQNCSMTSATSRVLLRLVEVARLA